MAPQDGLTSFQEGSTRAVPTTLCFASLPGEVRNHVYAQTLKCKAPITLSYDASTQRFQTLGAPLVDGRTPLQAVQLFSSIDHYIRQEARSYFFATNFFEITTKQYHTTDPDYVQVYINFLENIGETGRRSLRHLRLTVSGDSKQHRPSAEQARKLWDLLAGCMDLERLDLFLEVDYFYMDQHTAMKSYMSTEGFPVCEPWPVALYALQHMRNLKHLLLHIVFSSRWRYTELWDHVRETTAGYPEAHRLTRIRFQVKRPIEEAGELTDRVKGVLRQGLRQRIAIRVLPTETWDQYGPDVVFGRTAEGSDSLDLIETARVKPTERRFLY